MCFSWHDGEPNNMRDVDCEEDCKEDCGIMTIFDGKWNDDYCEELKPFFCELRIGKDCMVS